MKTYKSGCTTSMGIYAFPHMCPCCASRCINAILSHQTISAPTPAAVEERQVADPQLAETLNLQTPLKHHLTLQTAYCGSGVSKADDLLTWEASPCRAEGTRDPLRVWPAFLLKQMCLKRIRTVLLQLVGRSSHFLSMPHLRKKKKKKSWGKPCLLLFWHRKAIICSPGQPSDVLVWFLIFIPYDSTYSSVYSALRGSH